MSARTKPDLHLVTNAPQTPEEQLRQIVPALAEAEAVIAKVKQRMAEQTRELARKRGVTFIREEHVRREFGR